MIWLLSASDWQRRAPKLTLCLGPSPSRLPLVCPLMNAMALEHSGGFVEGRSMSVSRRLSRSLLRHLYFIAMSFLSIPFLRQIFLRYRTETTRHAHSRYSAPIGRSHRTCKARPATFILIHLLLSSYEILAEARQCEAPGSVRDGGQDIYAVHTLGLIHESAERVCIGELCGSAGGDTMFLGPGSCCEVRVPRK